MARFHPLTVTDVRRVEILREGERIVIDRKEDGRWQMEELLDTGMFVTGSGEDEAGNIYFTSCLCGYGQVAPQQEGALWMLVSADQVPDGAETAPLGEAGPPPAEDEGVASPESGDASTGTALTAASWSRQTFMA